MERTLALIAICVGVRLLEGMHYHEALGPRARKVSLNVVIHDASGKLDGKPLAKLEDM